MALKISELSAAIALAGADLLEVSQDNAGTQESHKLDLATLKAWLQFKNNLTATADPGVDDDSTAGYEPGSRWLNNTPSPKVWWICTDASAGAAVWDVLSLSEDELGTAALANTGTGAGDVPLNSDLGSASLANMESMPFLNKLADSGRYGGNNLGSGYPASDPFANNGFFKSYNGAAFTEAGKFIYNNSDFGGSAGNMTQTTVDLINAMDRSGTDARYGVEFYICSIDCGSGTNGADTNFASGTLYLMTTNGAQVIFGADNRCSMGFWLRAKGGVIGIGASTFDDFYVNGVDLGPQRYEIDPADGWVYVFSSITSLRGYNNAFPYFYGDNGRSLEIALPSLFAGRFNPGVPVAPLLGPEFI